MSARSPFVPARLAEVRLARDLSQTALADLMGVSTGTISNWETGRHAPSGDQVDKLARILNVQTHLFYSPARADERSTVFFRSMSAATKRARSRAEIRLNWAYEVAHYIEQFVTLPDVDLVSAPSGPWQGFTPAAIEEKATELRRSWGLGDGPISNLVWLLENHGILAVREEIGNRHLDAHSVIRRNATDRPLIFLSADKSSAVRSRFDAAHELGHLVLHPSIPRNQVRQPTLLKEIESQANRFAGAFLLPAESFVKEVEVASLDFLRALKPRWKVAIGAMINRLQQLRVIDGHQSTRLWKGRSARGWVKREPYDDDLAIEHPRLLRRALLMISDENIRDRADVIGKVGLSEADVERLCGLPEGYFQGEGASVFDLRLRNDMAHISERKPHQGPAQIYQFPRPRPHTE